MSKRKRNPKNPFTTDPQVVREVLKQQAELLNAEKQAELLSNTGVHDKMYELSTNGRVIGQFPTHALAQDAALVERQRDKKIGQISKICIKHKYVPCKTTRFRTPKRNMIVPVGTLVYVYRRVDVFSDRLLFKKPKGWIKYHLKKPRTFQEFHQVTTMNQGLLRTAAVKQLNSLKWIVFHTEEEDYPLIAFSAFTKDFPLEGTTGVHDLGGQPKDAFPFKTPLRYPPHGNTFERMFLEQKNAFIYKEGFKAGFDSRKNLTQDQS